MHLFTIAQQHVYGFEGRTSETIFIVGFGALVLVAMLVLKMSFRNWMLAAMMFVTCLAPSVDSILNQYNPTWMLSVTRYHAELHLVLGILLTILVLVTGGAAVRSIAPQSVLFFLMAFYAGMLQFIHEDAKEALQAIGFALATIPCFAIATAMSCRTHEGCVNLLRMMMWVIVAWTFCCSVQFVINPKYLVSYQGRFLGMLGNAQHAATLNAPMAVIAVWLLMHDGMRRTKLLWIALIAINLLFLGWSGSRTGGLMFMIGLMAVLYSRIGKAILLLPVAVVLLWMLSLLADALQIGANLERFVSTNNTRDWVWTGMLEAAFENPLIGVGWRSGEIGTENSYLGALSAYGILYFILTISLLIVSVWQCFSFNLRKQWLRPEHRALIDIFTAFNAMFFAGAFFEGFILARSYIPQLMLMIFAGIGVWIRSEIAYNREHAYEHVHPDEHAEYGELESGSLAHE